MSAWSPKLGLSLPLLCGCLATASGDQEPAGADDPTPPGQASAPEPLESVSETKQAASGDAAARNKAEAAAAPKAVAPRKAPPTPEDIEGLLADAAKALDEYVVRKTHIRHLRGPHPEHSGLDAAYAEKRAIGYEGSLAEVRTWMAAAKFGLPQASAERSKGPLYRYDLCVTRKGEQAWLHVIVPADGLAVERGDHFKAESRERWVLLSDHATPGEDYLPFKRSAPPSLSRQWGRETLVRDLVEMAHEYKERTGVHLGIGDISHVTGGKMKDHWTHRVGADADVYLLDYGTPDAEGRPQPELVFHSFRRSKSVWSTKPDGKGQRETPTAAGDDTLTASRLRHLADLVLERDEIAFFVHNDPVVLDAYDGRAGERKPGRRYLHAKNRGFWPRHDDHVHLRWVAGPLPVGVAPRP